MLRVLVLPEKTHFNISRQDETARGLLKDQTNVYFDFINQDNIKVYLVSPDTVNSQNNSLLTQLWFSGLDDWSDLDGSGNLDCSDRVRGVKKTSEAGSQPGKVPYTQRQVTQVAKILKGVREGNLPASKLEKALSFMEKL